MPQFDQFSFYNQVYWFIFLFLSFYFYITFFFLPQICYNLKFRRKKIYLNQYQTNQILFDKKYTIIFYNKIYTLFYNTFKLLLNNKISTYKIVQTFNLTMNFLFKSKINTMLNKNLNKKFLFLHKVFF